MDKFVKYVIGHQARFFLIYYIITVVLIFWSYCEGVGDIQGRIKILDGKAGSDILFKGGFFSTLNYGVYYVFVMPLFIKSVFETYKVAFKITDMPSDPSTDDDLIQIAIRNYSSKVINFLKMRSAWPLLIFLIVAFSFAGVISERKNMHAVTIGWVQGWKLQRDWKKEQLMAKAGKEVAITRDSAYYFKANFNAKEDGFLKRVRRIRITALSFFYERKVPPSAFEFTLFLCAAKIYYGFFEAFVFFYNFNMLYCIIYFFLEPNKETLFKSPLFVTHIEDLVTKISLTGFFLTIFVYFRYIANMQKGSFQPFNWGLQTMLTNDQYMFLVGMLFIPATSIILFLYIYLSDTVIDIKGLSFRRIASLYIPALSFLVIFFIYLLQFDPYMKGQLRFLVKPLKYVNEYLGG
jgi:hypothetical protein